jgi:hypothetical protein
MTAPLRADWLRLLAWLPIPLLLTVLWAGDLPGSYEPPYLLMALNFVFSTLVSGFIAYLIARSFSIRCTPGLRMLGCGVSSGNLPITPVGHTCCEPLRLGNLHPFLAANTSDTRALLLRPQSRGSVR